MPRSLDRKGPISFWLAPRVQLKVALGCQQASWGVRCPSSRYLGRIREATAWLTRRSLEAGCGDGRAYPSSGNGLPVAPGPTLLQLEGSLPAFTPCTPD